MPWMTGAAILGGSLISGWAGGQAASAQSRAGRGSRKRALAEQRRQFDLQRADTAPYREAGVNALNELAGTGRYGETLPQYAGGVGNIPEFAGGDRFNFNLEADPGYQFARDEAIKSANRAAAQSGKFNSGNRLAEIADRVTGVASQYANEAFGRQLAGSAENYGRATGEYGLQRAREADLYGRGLTGYGLDYQRSQDLYGREQNYLNRLAGIAGVGQTATGQSAAAGSNMANAVGNINLANAQMQAQAAGTRYGALNNAAQGGISNYLLYNQMQNQPSSYYGAGQTSGYGSNVLGDAYAPAYRG